MSNYLEKDELLKKIKDTFERDGYFKAYKVTEDYQLKYPDHKDFHSHEEDVTNNFRGTLSEINDKLEKAKRQDREDFMSVMHAYHIDSSEIRNVLVELAAKEGLPDAVSSNKKFINAIAYYALNDFSEPYNWASNFSEFWEYFERGTEALKVIS